MVFFTICSRNFLGYAQALRQGLYANHQGISFVLVLCDDPADIDLESYPFPIITVDKLGIPEWDRMTHDYNITELNTSVKPFAFLLLFDLYPDQPIVYLDPDILVVSEFRELRDYFDDGAECVLTPHVIEPSEFAEMNDLRILRYGVYNLGFCALVGSRDVRRVVSWWSRRLERECLIDLEAGIFVDQKWAELFPAYIERTKILRHAGYNVAYWNLSQRRVRRNGIQWLVNKEPLRFFHFSGNVIEDPAVFSRHSVVHTVDNLGEVLDLLDHYRDHVHNHGHDYYRRLAFAYRWSGSRDENEHTPESVRGRQTRLATPPHLPILYASSLAEFSSQRAVMMGVSRRRRHIEIDLVPAADTAFTIDGYCYCCGGPSTFQVSDMYSVETLSDGRAFPNWREHLNCLRCGLVNRMRAAFHLLDQQFRPEATDKIYITERTTINFGWLAERFRRVDGSEYFGPGHESGDIVDGVRHEDLQGLSFEPSRFDYVLSFDVLEHVPTPALAFSEIHRCLRSGGVLMFTVPFRYSEQEDEIRARLRADGSLEHILPAEYHGNPVDPETGALCYRYFGWQVLDDLREIGFRDVEVMSYWSRALAYLGDPQLIIVARK